VTTFKYNGWYISKEKKKKKKKRETILKNTFCLLCFQILQKKRESVTMKKKEIRKTAIKIRVKKKKKKIG